MMILFVKLIPKGVKKPLGTARPTTSPAWVGGTRGGGRPTALAGRAPVYGC